MPRFSRAVFCLLAFAAGAGGCGFDRLQPPIPSAPGGFTLERLQQIQDNTALTNDERREMIRAAIGAPDDANGDRLVDFLLGLVVP